MGCCGGREIQTQRGSQIAFFIVLCSIVEIGLAGTSVSKFPDQYEFFIAAIAALAVVKLPDPPVHLIDISQIATVQNPVLIYSL